MAWQMRLGPDSEANVHLFLRHKDLRGKKPKLDIPGPGATLTAIADVDVNPETQLEALRFFR